MSTASRQAHKGNHSEVVGRPLARSRTRRRLQGRHAGNTAESADYVPRRRQARNRKGSHHHLNLASSRCRWPVPDCGTSLSSVLASQTQVRHGKTRMRIDRKTKDKQPTFVTSHYSNFDTCSLPTRATTLANLWCLRLRIFLASNPRSFHTQSPWDQ